MLEDVIKIRTFSGQMMADYLGDLGIITGKQEDSSQRWMKGPFAKISPGDGAEPTETFKAALGSATLKRVSGVQAERLTVQAWAGIGSWEGEVGGKAGVSGGWFGPQKGRELGLM